MSAVNLEKSMLKLRKCYVGRENKTHKLFAKVILDKSKIDELEWIFAITRVTQAIQNKEITEQHFIEVLEGEDE